MFDYDNTTNNGVSDISFKDYILGTNTITGRKEQGYNGLNVISSFPSEKFAGIWGGTAGLKSSNGAWPFELINSETDVDYLRINPAYWQPVDERMQFLADEGFVTLFETVRRSERWRDGTPAEKDAFYNYVRYLWARYGCYNMIFSWVHHDSQSSIYPQWLPLVEDAHDELSDQLGNRMPYGQPRTAMFFGSTLDSWEKDIPDAIDVQSVSNDERDETMHEWLSEIYYDWDKHHTLGGPKPAFNLEPFYPGWGSHSSNEINSGLDATTMAQMQMYGSVLSGGLAGHAWGDGWHAGEGYAGASGAGVTGTGQINALTSYESQAMGHLRTFMLDSDHEYHRLKPAAHTNLSNNQNYIQTLSISDDKKFALGFLTTSYSVPNLINLLTSEPYRFEWWDVTNGVWINAGNSTTNGSGQLVPPNRPDNSKNWAYRIRTLDYNPNPDPSDFALHINTGGAATVYNGDNYVADNYFDTGSTLDRPQTGLPEPFQTFRYSPSEVMGYDIPLNNGDYTVRLHFAELWFGATGGGTGGVGSRIFDVSIEGGLVEDNLDVFAEAGADNNLVKVHTVTITDGALNIDFDSRDVVGGERHPIINAIDILEIVSDPPIADAGSDQTIVLPVNSVQLTGSGSDPDGGTIASYLWTKVSGPSATLTGTSTSTLTASNLVKGSYTFRLTVTDDEGDTASDDVLVQVEPIVTNNFVLRINSGGSSSATYLGNTFDADNQNGYTFSGSTLTTTGSSSFILAQPFKSVRYTQQQQMEYLIPVSNGDYEVILHFAEPYHGVHPGTDPDTRKFHVDIEGTRIETDLNIISEVGANLVYTVNHNASVSDGQLNLTFSEGSGNDPIINAIEILGIEDPNPADGLVGHWPLDEQNGTTASDVSGQGHDGSLVNGVSFDNDSGNGQIGDALIFDGTDDRINLPDIDDGLQSGFSVSAWINPASTSGYQAIVGTHTSTGFMTFVHNGKLTFALDTNVGREIKDFGSIIASQWQHIAVTYDGSTMTWYVDGVEAGTHAHTGQVSDRSNGYIGWSGWSNEYFDGAIDDAKVFDNPLTNNQINDLYTAGQSPLPDSAGHWPLDEQNGTTASDVSGQSHDGSLVNGMSFDNDSGNGQIGDALIFDGSDDRIDLPDIDNDLQSGFSVSAWINPQNTNGYTAIAGTHTSQGFMTFINGGKLAFALLTDSGTRKLKSHGTIVTNQWQHIAVTYDGAAMKWYIGGDEVGSEPHSGQVSDRNNGYIGWSGWSTEYFDGGIDDVRLYESALTPSEVETLFQNGGGSTNLTAKADLSVKDAGISFVLPNPTKGRFRITGLPQGTREIMVSDFSSRVLMTLKTDKDEHELDLSAFPDGIYIVKVFQNGSEQTFKVVKK